MNLDDFDPEESAAIVAHAAAKKLQLATPVARTRNAGMWALTLGLALLAALAATPMGAHL